MELDIEIDKNYLEITNEKQSHNSQMLNKFIKKDTFNKLDFKIEELVDLISNKIHNGYKPLYLGQTVEYMFWLEPNNMVKTFDGRIIKDLDIKNEVKDRINKLYNNPIVYDKDIEIIKPTNKHQYYYVYGKFAEEANKEKWLYQHIFDLKKLQSNQLEKLDKNLYKLNIFDKEFNLSFLEKDYGASLIKLNKINNQYQQFKYIELLMENKKINIKKL